jgi:uncharacterized protein (DUF433 family)
VLEREIDETNGAVYECPKCGAELCRMETVTEHRENTRRWDLFPDRTGRIVRNPLIQFGEPTIRSRRVTVGAIQSRVLAGESKKSVADDYHVEMKDIDAAMAYRRDREESRAMNLLVPEYHRCNAR